MKLLKISMVMMVISLVIKVSGLLREIVIGKYFGVNEILDQYILASLLPIILASSLASSINIIGIKYISATNLKKDKINSFYNNLLVIGLIIIPLSSIISLLLYKVHYFNQEVLLLFNILLPSIMFFMLNGFYKSLLHYNNKFYISNFVALPYNLMIILFVIFFSFSESHIYYLAVGTTIGVLLQTVLLYWGTKSNNLIYKIKFKLRGNDILGFLKLFPFIIIGSLILPLNLVIDRVISSVHEEGTISLVNYANNIIAIPLGLIITNVFSVYFPLLSKLISKKKYKVLNKIINKIIKYLAVLSILLILVIPIVKPILTLLFARGEFKMNDITELSNIVICYFPLIIGICLYEITSRIFYIENRKVRIYLLMAMITILNIVFSLILSPILSIYAIPLSTGISFILVSLFFLLIVKEENKKRKLIEILKFKIVNHSYK